MDPGLRGRAAVVGGASSGLGAAIADALATEGCRLLLWSRSLEHLQTVAAPLRDRTELHLFAADASDPDCAAAVAEAAGQLLGPVDILVLNAGGPPTVDPTDTLAAGWQSALQLLAMTPIELATALLPGMRERGWGRIVAVLSSGVRQPIPELVYSNAGRSALAAWLKTTARTVAAEGVTINGVLPGRLETPASPPWTARPPSDGAWTWRPFGGSGWRPSRPVATAARRSFPRSLRFSPRSLPPTSPGS